MRKPECKICTNCGTVLEVGEVCDCMLNAPQIAGREYRPARHKDGSIHYYGFPVKPSEPEKSKRRSKNYFYTR